MRLTSSWKVYSRPLLVVLALIGIGASTRAQSTGEDDAYDQDERAAMNLNVTFSADGSADAHLSVFGVQNATPYLKTLLESSLDCTLHDKRAVPSGAFVYVGSCRPSFTRVFMTRQFQISLAPLRQFAHDHQIEVLTVALRLPDVEITETQPHLDTQSSALGRFSVKFQRLSELNRVYSWKDASSIPDLITIRFGVSSQSATRTAVILLAVLLFPAILIYWMGRKALSSEAQDKAAVWFTYMRYLQWTLNLALIGWWVAADSLHLEALLKFVSAGTPFAPAWGYVVTPVILNWIPPAIVWIVCFVLSHPVQEKLRGLTWTRRELALQAFYSFCVSLLPFAMVLTGITTIATGSMRIAFFWFVGAYAVRIFAARARQKFLGMQPQALTTGDLRDRAFAMAKQLGVKLQQIYIIPSGKGQMANAFARSGNIISFTDFLLQRMSRREVDYVLGHELSHLKLGHPGKLALTAVISYFAAFTALSFTDPFFHFSTVTRYALIVAIVTLAPYFCSRRFEYAADASAVAVTGDPHAAVSALFKIAQLNMLPIHWSKWSEKWLTHPSSLRRAHAIAHKAGIPAEQVQGIAQAAAAADDSCYVLPDTVAPGSKVHSTQRKQGGSLRTAFSMLAVIIFTPAAFTVLAAHSGSGLRLRLALYLAGFAATLGMYFVFANYMPPMGLRRLVAGLKTKLAAQGILADSWDGVFVGFSPAAAPRSYELNTNWDLGCLFLRSERLCYCGEETKFSLRRDQVTAITLAPGMPGLLPPWRVYLAWKDEELGRSGVFNIGCINGSSTLRLRKQTSNLADRLKLWSGTSASARPMPAPLEKLTSPDLGPVTGAIPGKSMQSGKVFNELLFVVLFAVVGAVLCGLPFHLISYLFAAANPSVAQFMPVHSPGAGWYVVAVALCIRFIALIPLMRYKDRAIVTLAPTSSNPKTPISSPPASNRQESGKIEAKDAVLTR